MLLNSIKDGLFRGSSQNPVFLGPLPLPTICHTYPTMMKLDTVISYPKKIQKLH